MFSRLLRPTVGAALSTAFYLSSVSPLSHMEKHSGDDLARQPSFLGTTNLRKNASIKSQKKIQNDVTLDDLLLIAGNSHISLATEISSLLGVQMSSAEITRFSDGEVSVKMNDSLRGKNVFILQSCVAPVNENIMELLLAVSCARRAGASRVIAVIPYFGYKHHRRGSSLSTKHHSRFLASGATDFAKMLQEMGVDRVIAVDLQRAGQGHEACFFDNSVPTETVVTTDYLVEYFLKNVSLSRSIVVVSPNAESVKRARNFQLGFQDALGSGTDVQMAAFMIEQTGSEGHSTHRLLGHPKLQGADVIIVDDMVDTAGTLDELTTKLVSAGAKNIYLCASHGLFTEKSMDVINNSAVKQVVVTNTLPLPAHASPKIHQVSVAPMLAEVIRAEHFRSVNFRGPEPTETFKDDDE